MNCTYCNKPIDKDLELNVLGVCCGHFCLDHYKKMNRPQIRRMLAFTIRSANLHLLGDAYKVMKQEDDKNDQNSM